jgi:hypothetical protein
MADVATRDLNRDDVLKQRIVEIYVTDGTDKKWRIANVRHGLAVTAFENAPNVAEEALVDGSSIREVTSTNHVIEFTVNEINEADLIVINGATITTIGWVTSTGGANGTGRDCKLATVDMITANVSGSQTIIRAEKSVSGKNSGFAFTDNGA